MTTPDPLVAAFQAAEAMTAEQAGQRLAELMWYAAHNVLLPDSELAEAVTLAAKLGVRLAWRHMVLSEGVWRDGRYGEQNGR